MLKRFRFSIRTVLLVTAIVAACVWWFALPTAMANRFARLVNNGKHEEAGELFRIDGASSMLTEWKPIVEAHAVVTNLTAQDLIRGRRAIHLSVTYHRKYSPGIPGFFPVEADRHGIYLLKNLKTSDKARFDFK